MPLFYSLRLCHTHTGATVRLMTHRFKERNYSSRRRSEVWRWHREQLKIREGTDTHTHSHRVCVSWKGCEKDEPSATFVMAQTLAGVLIHTRRENRSNQGEATGLNVTPERKRDCESLTMVVLHQPHVLVEADGGWWRPDLKQPHVLVEDGGLQRPCFNCFG